MTDPDLTGYLLRNSTVRARYGWLQVDTGPEPWVTLGCRHRMPVPELPWLNGGNPRNAYDAFTAAIEAAERPCSCVVQLEEDRERERVRVRARRPDLTQAVRDAVWAAEYVRAFAETSDAAESVCSANRVAEALKEHR